ncbi:hypothetical protein PC9H_008910 [Pleurotus ostreatus]|uniref:Uncharacterized protein n=1 Tax=Pleurotus ostreatus TaxID=5322 RepID=A0A8H7DTJ6_PLEOS|nr:uncharacterized protein PC9H_008910 [Pleurotus ostreatus]KAF7426541.1 hypothetical protein PC9H_008910 [Pleurotus ostreatus]KAJ8694104.1 hypothetical protein PTI98_009037 [Pleurotus ostreatus]
MQSTQLFFWLLLGSILPALLHASVVLPRGVDVKKSAKHAVASAASATSSASAAVSVDAMATTAISLISKNNKESKVTSTAVEVPSTPHAAIQQVINDMHGRNKSISLVAVKLFTLVEGDATLGVPGKDWGTVWIPVQPSASSPSITYVVWWTRKRGGTLMITNPASPDDISNSSIQVGRVSKGVKVGVPIGPNKQIVYT